MAEQAPVAEISGHFETDVLAREVASALNRWFRWIIEGSQAPISDLFSTFGVAADAYAWTLGEDVDWQLGPHARAVGEEVRISIQTHDTHHRVCGLLRRLGATRTKVVRET